MSKTDSILAIDPGLNNPAAALFRHGRLIKASRIKPHKEWKSLVVGERCRLIARKIHEWTTESGLDEHQAALAYLAEMEGRLEEAHQRRQDHGVVAVVVEWPQIYRAGKSKGDPNDLPPLVGVAMCLAGRLDVEVRSYKPKEWIGGVPKSETGDARESPRGRKVWRCLDDTERAVVTVSHDSLDAIGLGLFDLGRLFQRVYPTG